MNNIKNEYNSIKQAKVDEYITSLPSKQREVVKACLDAAKCKSSNGRRYYTKCWAYECLLMRIKSPKLYRKIRKDNVMPLPSFMTLSRYIKKLNPAYGFSQATFEIIGMKSKYMNAAERHGKVFFFNCLMVVLTMS